MHQALPEESARWDNHPQADITALDTRRVRDSAARLRRQVSRWIGDSPRLSDHLEWLAEHGYGREDSRQIRYVVEVFYQCEPLFAITHAISPGGRRSADCFDSIHEEALRLYASSAYNFSTQGCANPARASQPHQFFRALTTWSDYFSLVLREILLWDAFPELVSSAATEARSLATEIWTGREADYPAGRSARSERMIGSCEVVVVTSALRRMFVNSEVAARHAAGIGLRGQGPASAV